jgi:manganese/iron transport system permease protein
MAWLIEPWTWPFMQTALLAAMLVGVSCSVVGVFVVQRRMAYIGDALAHTTLPGIAIAFLLGFPLGIGAMIAGLVTAWLIADLTRGQQLKEDSAIGIVFTGMFALGVILLSRTKTYSDLTHILLGQILAVSPKDLAWIATVTVIVLVVVLLLWKELELTSYDPVYAESLGISPDRLRRVLLLLLACVVVSAIQVVGLILTTALLLTPATIGGLWSRKLQTILQIACGSSILAAVGGLWLSFHASVPAGASIVLVAVAGLVLSQLLLRCLGSLRSF